MPKYICKTTVHFNGDAYAAGDPIDLTAKHAEPLLRVAAIEPAPEDKAKKDPAAGKTKTAE
ncbi:conserved hypothetical protein [Thiomonas sp. CB3]|nr:conserved hypothetical protein [Thiomonas sp. CB3]